MQLPGGACSIVPRSPDVIRLGNSPTFAGRYKSGKCDLDAGDAAEPRLTSAAFGAVSFGVASDGVAALGSGGRGGSFEGLLATEETVAGRLRPKAVLARNARSMDARRFEEELLSLVLSLTGGELRASMLVPMENPSRKSLGMPDAKARSEEGRPVGRAEARSVVVEVESLAVEIPLSPETRVASPRSNRDSIVMAGSRLNDSPDSLSLPPPLLPSPLTPPRPSMMVRGGFASREAVGRWLGLAGLVSGASGCRGPENSKALDCLSMRLRRARNIFVETTKQRQASNPRPIPRTSNDVSGVLVSPPPLSFSVLLGPGAGSESGSSFGTKVGTRVGLLVVKTEVTEATATVIPWLAKTSVARFELRLLSMAEVYSAADAYPAAPSELRTV
mmetsp:Transcript_37912/g.84682  ORF Transcript_37912/g.84682 Transcript_37912/m.84682 type:complete len:389 (+) Transcript_37912:176-1342(+)